MKKIAIVALLSTAVLSSAAFAADEGFYVGVNAGRANSDYAGAKSATGFTLQGGYQFNKNFAVEAQYFDLGDFGPAVVPVGQVPSAKVAGLSAVAVGILPFNDQWSGYGKLGVATTDTKVSGSPTAVLNGTTGKTAITYGIGGQFNVNPALGIRFGVDQYKTGGTTTLPDGTSTFISAGVVYKF